MHNAILSGWIYIPYGVVRDLGLLRKELTHRPRPAMDGTRRDPVELFKDYPDRELIAVPQAYGKELFGPYVNIVDHTVLGSPIEVPRLPTPDHPAVENPKAQARFMRDMEAAAREHRTFTVCAPTGTGKTVVALRTAAVVGRTTLIMVHLERLRDQWVDEIQEHLGVDRKRIGLVDGNNCDFRDKDFVVGMLQSIAFKPHRYPKEFYSAFGTIIPDEVHRIGAPVFSQAIWQFNARYRWGLSATPTRKDGGDKVFFWHIGPIRVTSQQRALPMEVWPVWHNNGRHKLWGKNHGARMKCLSQDKVRNDLICKLTKKMYDAGRQTIVVAEAVGHLQTLMTMCERAGIPADAMGQFTGEVHYQEKMRVGDREQLVAKKRKQKARTLDRIMSDSQIIFATYGMMKEGIDIPRLDSGIDATPRADAAQLIGRIRRPHPGKRSPILWVTIVDANCDRSLRYYEARCREYAQTGAEVKHRG